MSDALPLIRQLQAEAVNPDASVTNLLRMAKIAATKLNLSDALVWIDRELNGYMDLKTEDLPRYRRLTGSPKGFNPFRGWMPIHFGDSEHATLLSQAPIGVALGTIERQVKGSSSGKFAFPYPPDVKLAVQKSIDGPDVDVHVEIDHGQLWNIVEQVRNLILNWTLEMEKAGIVGENMQFSEKEKRDAGTVTHQYFIQNAGVVGNVTDQATVTNRQTATIDLNLDMVRDFVKQARAAVPSLPYKARKAAPPLLEGIERELQDAKPNTSKIRELLGSLRKITESATGNLTAQGIVAMARIILGA